MTILLIGTQCAQATVLPAPVVTATPGNGQIKLTWTAVPGAIGYNIYQYLPSEDDIRVVAHTTTALSCTIIGQTTNYAVPHVVSNQPDGTPQIGGSPQNIGPLTNDGHTYYNFEVAAVGTDCEGQWSVLISSMPSMAALPPPTCQGLTARLYTTTGVNLRWNTIPGITNYNIYRSSASGAETFYATATSLDAYAVHFDDTGLTPGSIYYYTVTAVSSSGESAPSDEVSAQVGSPVLPATSPTSSQADSRVTLSWPAVAGATGYNIYLYAPPPTDDIKVIWHTTSALSYTITGLANGTQYAFQVVAVGPTGEGSLGNPIYATPTSGSQFLPVCTGLTARRYVDPNTSKPYVALRWNYTQNIYTYKVYRGTAPGQPKTLVYTTTGSDYNAAAVHFDDKPIIPGSTYYYAVTAVSGTAESVPSDDVRYHDPISNAYVAVSNGTVAMIDTTTNTVLKTITIGTTPGAIALTPDGTRAYVLGGSQLSVIDTNPADVAAYNTVIGQAITIPNGGGLNLPKIVMAPNGKRAYIPIQSQITENATAGVFVLNTDPTDHANYNTVSQINFGPTAPYVNDLIVTPDSLAGYIVVNSGSAAGTIQPINLTTYALGTPIQPPTSTTFMQMAMSSDGKRLYALAQGTQSPTYENYVAVIDTNSADGTAYNTVGSIIDTHQGDGYGDPPSYIKFRPDQKRVYVSNGEGSSFSIIDTDPGDGSNFNTVLANIDGNGYDTSHFDFTGDSTKFYITTVDDGHSLLGYDTAKLEETGQNPVLATFSNYSVNDIAITR